MLADIVGAWRLAWWKRIVGETTSFPLGEDAIGILIYTSDLKMAVQMMANHRPAIDSNDALGGDPNERAAAYSTCLAYFGTFEIRGESIVHTVKGSLYPNWSGTMAPRPYTWDGALLVLRTPPSKGPGGTVINEIAWAR